jgi:hypothetical protein
VYVDPGLISREKQNTKIVLKNRCPWRTPAFSRRGRVWWRGGDGGLRPGRGPGDAECHRVSHFCGAVARARATQAAARAHAAGRDVALGGRHCVCPWSLHCERRSPILGSSCSPNFSGGFSRTVGARACAPRPWLMLECKGTAMLFSRTSAAAAGCTAQLRSREKSSKIARLAHYNFAQSVVVGRWFAQVHTARLMRAISPLSKPCDQSIVKH